MNIHELEERDFYPASDHGNAVAWSRMTTTLKDPAVRIALDAGLHAVVYRALAFCSSTDACIGEREELIAAYKTAEGAERESTALNATLNGYEDCYYTVLGPAPPPAPVEPWGDDELPF